MNPVMEIILGVAGSLILLLLAFIGYFLKQFAISVTDLKKSVESLKTVVSVIEERISHIRESITKSDNSINKELEAITKKVEDHDKDILIIKTTLNIE